jgi:hypothetical protein
MIRRPPTPPLDGSRNRIEELVDVTLYGKYLAIRPGIFWLGSIISTAYHLLSAVQCLRNQSHCLLEVALFEMGLL